MCPVTRKGARNVLCVHLKKVLPVASHMSKHVANDLSGLLGAKPCNLSTSRNQVVSTSRSCIDVLHRRAESPCAQLGDLLGKKTAAHRKSEQASKPLCAAPLKDLHHRPND